MSKYLRETKPGNFQSTGTESSQTAGIQLRCPTSPGCWETKAGLCTSRRSSARTSILRLRRRSPNHSTADSDRSTQVHRSSRVKPSSIIPELRWCFRSPATAAEAARSVRSASTSTTAASASVREPPATSIPSRGREPRRSVRFVLTSSPSWHVQAESKFSESSKTQPKATKKESKVEFLHHCEAKAKILFVS